MILNHFVLPSAAVAFSTFVMYTETGPWWYTLTSAFQVTFDPAVTAAVVVFTPVWHPVLQRRSFEA